MSKSTHERIRKSLLEALDFVEGKRTKARVTLVPLPSDRSGTHGGPQSDPGVETAPRLNKQKKRPA